MTFGVSNRGEELQYTSGYTGTDVELYLYLDSTDTDGDGTADGDDLDDTSTYADVTTDPGGYGVVTHSIVSSDVGQFNGDYGIEFTETIDVSNTEGDVDGLLLVEAGTDNIIARSEIQNAEPGPYQSLDGLSSLEVTPRVTSD